MKRTPIWAGVLVLVMFVGFGGGSDGGTDGVAGTEVAGGTELLEGDLVCGGEYPEPVVELVFGGEIVATVATHELSQAVVRVRASGYTTVILANDPSFMAGAWVVELGDGGEMSCTKEEVEGVLWLVCEKAGWDLTEGLDDALPGQYWVYARFLDECGNESLVKSAGVALDSVGPVVLHSEVTPWVLAPGSEAIVTVVFDGPVEEAVLACGDGEGSAVECEGSDGLQVSGPAQVGESTSYIWTVEAAQPRESEGEWFELWLEAMDSVGNVTQMHALSTPEGEPLRVLVDSVPPVLVAPEEIVFSRQLFGIPSPDVDDSLTFDFVVAELNAALAVVGGECPGDCPEVRLCGKLIGEVARAEELDDPAEGHLGFSYVYMVSEADFSATEQECAVSIQWQDLAGNEMEAVLPDEVVFDFEPPVAVACSLTPEVGNMESVFKYTLTASEELAMAPELKVEGIGEFGFFQEPLVSENGLTFTWEQAAWGLPSQSFAVSAQLTDLAGNGSGGPVCSLTGMLAGEAPELLGAHITTMPEVLDESGSMLLACGDGGVLQVVLEVNSPAPMAEGYPVVQLSVPGMPVQLEQVEVNEDGGGVASYTYALTLDAQAHAAAEGSWPLKVVVKDVAGNETVVEGLNGQLVRIDFTPPVAECQLVPPGMWGGYPYPVGQKFMLLVTPYELLAPGFLPLLLETTEPPVDLVVFQYEPSGPTHKFSHMVEEGEGEYTFEVDVKLTDLVGNETPAGATACGGGTVSGTVDGIPPEIVSAAVTASVDGDPVDLLEPLGVGALVTVSVELTETEGPPDVFLGASPMVVTGPPVEVGGGVFTWTFEYLLTGAEEPGLTEVTVMASDPAGNFLALKLNQELTLQFD